MSIAMQNMIYSPKKSQLTISKHSKKFTFRLEKYSNTQTVYTNPSLSKISFIQNKLVS